MPATTMKKARKAPAADSRVAKYARDVLGGPGHGGPGPKQVKAVRRALRGKDPVEASGLSRTRLRSWAVKGERPTGEPARGMRELGRKVNDPWARGRKLAAVLDGLDRNRG